MKRSQHLRWEEEEEDLGLLSDPTSSSQVVDHTKSSSYGATRDADSESSMPQSYRLGEVSTQQTKVSCWKILTNRVPKGKGPLIIFVLNVIESFCFYGLLRLINHSLFGGQDDPAQAKGNEHTMLCPEQATIATMQIISTVQISKEMGMFLYFSLFQYSLGRVFYPFAGLLADVYFGRHRVMQLGWWLFWCGFAIYLITQSIEMRFDAASSHLFQIPYIIMSVLLVLGSACIEATIIPFGMDQVEQGASSEELSSYFFWYYFGRQLGYFSNVLLYLLLISLYYKKLGSPLDIDHIEADITEALVAIILISGAFLFQFFANKWLFKARQRENPVKLVIGVIFFAATVKRQAPRYRRSFRYGEGRLPRIELAKIKYDGTYSSEEVEDVKTFVRLLFIFFCLGAVFICYSAVVAMYTGMLKNAKEEDITIVTDNNGSHAPFDFFSITQPVMVCVVILILNHALLPFFPNINMKRRLGVGAVFMVLSVLSATILVISYKKLKHPFYWIFLPVGFFSVADTCIFVTGLEFISAQSPDSIKGFLIGLFYCIFGVFSSIGIVIYYYLQDPCNGNLRNFFYVILAISVVGVVVYVLGSLCYKNRQRPTNDDSEQDLINRSIAANVYLSGAH